VEDGKGQAPDGTDADDSANADGGDGSQDDRKTDSELARARSEAAKYRTELREAQAQLKDLADAQKERDDAEKSELQKATERATNLEGQVSERDQKLRDLTLAQEVYKAAQKLDIVDPDAAFQLLDKKAVEYEGEQPKNIDDLLTSLVEAKPYLKRTAKGAAPKSSTTQPDGKKKAPLTRADIEKMTDDEVAARYDEVLAVMADAGLSG
jgi:chromosome segregation ATPase